MTTLSNGDDTILVNSGSNNAAAVSGKASDNVSASSATASSFSSNGPSSGFNRTQKACDLCRRRKTKCTGEIPCACCVLHKVECTHNYKRKKRTTYKKSSHLASKKIKVDPGAASVPVSIANVQPGFVNPGIYYMHAASPNSVSSIDPPVPASVSPSSQQDDISNSNNGPDNDSDNNNGNVRLLNSRISSLEASLSLLTSRLESVTKMQEFTLSRLMQVLENNNPTSLRDTPLSSVIPATHSHLYHNSNSSKTLGLSSFGNSSSSASPVPPSSHPSMMSQVLPQVSTQSQQVSYPPPLPAGKPSNRKMRIADIIDRDIVIEKNPKRQIINSLMDLVNAGGSLNIFEQASFQWIKKITGENFNIYFQPIIDELETIVKQKRISLKKELDSSQEFTEHYLKYKDLIITLVTNVIQLQMKNFYVGGKTYTNLMKDVLTKFLLFMDKLPNKDDSSSSILSDSDNLLLNSMICLSCTYSHSKLFSLVKEGNLKFKYTYADDKAICVSKKTLLEIEDLSMKNCFFYFNKLIDHHEGEKTIIALLTLCSYVKSTIFSRCNYLIMSVTAKHVQSMRLHRARVKYTADNEVDLTQLSSSILWWRCYMTDKDISSTIEKRPIIKHECIHDDIFLEFSRVTMMLYCKRRKILTNPDFERLKKIKLKPDKSIQDQKEFFAVLNNISKYNAFGYSILINYYLFTLIKLITKHSKEVFFNNIIRKVGENDSSESLDAFFKALEVNDDFNKDFRIWEYTVPESIRPSSKLDTSEYFNFDVSIFPYIQYFDGAVDGTNKFMVLDGYKIDFESLDSNDRSGDYNYLLQAKFKYFFHLMKVNRLAYNSCYMLYSRLNTFDYLTLERLELARKTLLSKMKKYESIYIENAVNIIVTCLGSSMHVLDVVYYGSSFILSAFFIIFMYIVSRFTEGVQTVCINDSISLSEYINLLHILIDCYIKCFSESAVIVRHLKSNFFEELTRRAIMLSIANLKDKSDFDISNDYKVSQFHEKCKSVDKSASASEKGKDDDDINNNKDTTKKSKKYEGDAYPKVSTTTINTNFKTPLAEISVASPATKLTPSENIPQENTSAGNYPNYFDYQFPQMNPQDVPTVESNRYIPTNGAPQSIITSQVTPNMESAPTLFDNDNHIILNTDTNAGDPGNIFTDIDESGAFSLNGQMFIDSDLLSMNFNF